MVFMNFNVSFIGLFMAAKLDEIMRVLPHREEDHPDGTLAYSFRIDRHHYFILFR